jgi:hypothetical protein
MREIGKEKGMERLEGGNCGEMDSFRRRNVAAVCGESGQSGRSYELRTDQLYHREMIRV